MAGDEKKRARFMSTAGPSLPVTNRKTDDVVPPGSAWLERMHAPKEVDRLAEEDRQAQEPSAEFHEAPRPSTGSFKAKSALSLVEELNAQQATPKPFSSGRQIRTAQARAISEVKIEEPEEVLPKKRLSAKLWIGIMMLVVAALVVVAWDVGFKEPPPESARDHTELETKIALRKKAVTIVNKAHELAVQGPKKSEAAIAMYGEALKLDPELASAHKGLGSVLLRAKKVDLALKHYRRYVKLKPNADDADTVRGILNKHTDDPMRPKGGVK
jgi:tetratricopeptide (TPR) repeat protein